jgi:hypothetical protein
MTIHLPRRLRLALDHPPLLSTFLPTAGAIFNDVMLL